VLGPPGLALLVLAALAGSLPVPAAAQAAGEPAATPPAAGTAAESSGSTLTEITIEARRADMLPRLTSYVTSITRTTARDEALHRWHTPVCPAVLGMPREQGEFVVARFSQIARDAGVRLDGERCRINLAVVFTSDPDALINAWARRRRAFEGVRGTPADFDHFRLAHHPVRVWYNKAFGSPGPLLQGSMQLARFRDVPTGGGDLTGSKMFVKDVLVFSSVAVIVDTREIRDLGIGQVADYVSMVALADTDLDHPLPDSPTILRLFQARTAGASVPGAVSDWDEAFLKELYSSKLDLITQRSMITNRMLEDLVPRHPVEPASAPAQ
jgi:hypothetical protein